MNRDNSKAADTDDARARWSLHRVLIANRGEIAVRIVRACHSLGIEAVVAVSEADVDSAAARLAGSQVVIGSARPLDSYLSIPKIVGAALRTSCTAVHPGYGFLSERADFARACLAAGLVFVGPSPEAIATMGDKITASGVAREARVPCLPGSGALRDSEAAEAEAQRVGYPVLLKASAGGGGRGMRVVKEPGQLPAAFAGASAEAEAAFGDGTLYLEKLIERARHVEVQVMGDMHGQLVHLGERECSTQRRHQKLLEEAPSTAIDPVQRSAMGACAVDLARRVGYCGAGTVEFVLDERDGQFYFLEMNTRIQVEHGVTEMVTGLDLVAEQLRVAAGLPLSFSQDDVVIRGHAIECRINAEDPDKHFLPRPGIVRRWLPPMGPGVRCDSHCHDGHVVTPHYDSLIAKVIVHAPTRVEAISRMRQALADLVVEGPVTTASFHEALLNHPDFAAGMVTTRWVEDVFLPERAALRRRA